MDLDNFADEASEQTSERADTKSSTSDSASKPQERESAKDKSTQEATNKETDDKRAAKQAALEKEVNELRDYVAQQKAKDAFTSDVQALSKEYRDFDINKVMEKIKSYDPAKQEELWRKGKDGLELVYLKEFKQNSTNNSFDGARSLVTDNLEELGEKVASGKASNAEQKAFWSAAAEL